MGIILSLKNVSKVFNEGTAERIVVLRGVSLEINSGEFFVLIGPSGSGKSTLLRIMSGLEKNYQGEVRFSEAISLTDISFVFQHFALLPWLTVFENVALGLRFKKLSRSKESSLVKKEIETMGLGKFSGSYPHELSGGMRQRVGLARALVRNPKIIFMDEPFSELDSFTAEEMRKEIIRIWRERKITVVMVTHFVGEALELADRIAVMTPRPGKIEKVITNVLPRPRDKRSADFYLLEDEVSKLIKP